MLGGESIMEDLRDKQGTSSLSLKTAVILIAFVVIASVFAFIAASTGLFTTEKEVRVTADVTASPMVKGGTTFFTFSPAPDRILSTERLHVELGSRRFQISGNRYEIDWESGVIIFDVPLEPGMKVKLIYKLPLR